MTINNREDQLLEQAVNASVQVGDLLLQGFANLTEVNFSFKEEGINNIVTEMDTMAEQFLREALLAGNDCKFIGEESGGDSSTEYPTWVVDPIDGTVNYAHGIPIWSISIALVLNNEPILGVVRNPLLNETFTAIKGKGAYLNNRKIEVSTIDTINRSLLVTGFPYNVNENPHGTIDVFSAILQKGLSVRRLGSAALDLAYVAAGRFDGYWESTLSPWDVAAGILLVNEAGGRISQYLGDAESISTRREIITDHILATNQAIHNDLRSLLISLRHEINNVDQQS